MIKLLLTTFAKKNNRNAVSFQHIALPMMDRLYRTAFLMTRDARTAEEVVFRTYATAYEQFHRLKHDTKVDLWMFRLLISTLSENSNKEAPEPTREFLVDPCFEAVRRLPEEYRDVVVLSDVSDLNHSEISDLLGCSIGDVQARLLIGRRLLAQSLGTFTEHLADIFDT